MPPSMVPRVSPHPSTVCLLRGYTREGGGVPIPVAIVRWMVVVHGMGVWILPSRVDTRMHVGHCMLHLVHRVLTSMYATAATGIVHLMMVVLPHPSVVTSLVRVGLVPTVRRGGMCVYSLGSILS
jgi:hypothetical protein